MPDLRMIPLGKTEQFAIVDAADFEFLSRWKWALNRNSTNLYAKRTTYADGKYGTVFMHRAIMKAGKGIEVDHRDGCGLNNSRSNLRICSRAQNSRNRRMHRGGEFKGVRLTPSTGRYRATIVLMGEHFHIGYFAEAVDAATAYNFRAGELFGEFARFNIPTGQDVLQKQISATGLAY